MPNTLTIIGGWNSKTTVLLAVPKHLLLEAQQFPSKHLPPSLQQGFEQFRICCTHMSKRNDKPTMPNSLTIVGGWNSDTIQLYLNTYFCFNFLLYHPLQQGFEQFRICCTHMSKRNDKLTMPNTLTIVGGWNSDTIQLYLNTYFSSNLPTRV